MHQYAGENPDLYLDFINAEKLQFSNIRKLFSNGYVINAIEKDQINFILSQINGDQFDPNETSEIFDLVAIDIRDVNSNESYLTLYVCNQASIIFKFGTTAEFGTVGCHSSLGWYEYNWFFRSNNELDKMALFSSYKTIINVKEAHECYEMEDALGTFTYNLIFDIDEIATQRYFYKNNIYDRWRCAEQYMPIYTKLYELIEKKFMDRIFYVMNNQLSVFIFCGYGLESVPSALGDCDSVEVLYLFGNRLTQLPQSIRNLHKLRIVDITDNHFSESPSELHSLNADLKILI